MSIDDTFRWIADMPSVMLPADDQGIFPDLDDSVTVAIPSPELSPKLSSETKPSPKFHSLLPDLSSLCLEPPISGTDSLESSPRKSSEPFRKLRSLTPLSSIPSLTDDVSEISTPRALHPVRLAELNALVRDALQPSPEAADTGSTVHTGLGRPFRNELVTDDSPLGAATVGATSDSPLNSTLTSPPVGRSVPFGDLLNHPKSSHSLPTARPSTSWLENLQTSPIEELPSHVFSPLSPAPKPAVMGVRSLLHKLSDENWQTIYALCGYLDRYPAEPVDRDTTVNICDIEDAARKLGVPLPLPIVIIEAMVRIGCQMPQQSSQPQWLTTAYACEQSFREREHEEYELEHLREQQNIAAALNIKLAQRRFLGLWHQVWRAKVSTPSAVAVRFRRHYTLPNYLKLWQLKLRRERLKTQTAHDINTATTLAAVVELWQTRTDNELTWFAKSCHISQKIAIFTAMQRWRHKLSRLVDLTQLAYGYRRRSLQSNAVKTLREHHLLNHAHRLRKIGLLRAVVCTWRHKQRQTSNQAIQATRHHCHYRLRHWQRYTQSCQQAHELSISPRFTQPLQKACLKRWRNELLVIRWRQSIDRQYQISVLLHWRRAVQTQTIIKLRTRHTVYAVIRDWRQQLTAISTIFDDTNQLLAASDREGAQLCVEVWRKRQQNQQILRAASTKMYAFRCKQQFWQILRYQFHANRTANSIAIQTYRTSLLAVIFRHWFQKYDSLRQQRLAALEQQTEVALLRTQCRAMLHQWRQSTTRERRQRQLIPKLLQQSYMRTLLLQWRARTQSQITNEARAVQLLTNRTLQIYTEKWQQRLNQVQTMILMSEDLDLARLALVMRSTTQHWQLWAADRLAQRARAVSYRQTQLRRLQLTLLNRWREKLSDNSADFSFSVYDSPTKLAAVSPQLISKLRRRNESTPRFFNMATPNMATPNLAAPNLAAPNLATPNLADPLRQFRDRSLTTPTKPFRSQIPNSLPSTPARPPW